MAAIRYERDENGNLIAVPFTPTYNNGNHFAGTGDTKGRGAVRMSDQAYRALTQGGAQAGRKHRSVRLRHVIRRCRKLTSVR